MNGSMKPFIKAVVFLLLSGLLEGCWDRTELNDLAIITALAFDHAENHRVRVTVQVIIPQSQAGGGAMGGGISGGGAAKRTTVRTEIGIDAADALSKLQRLFPRKLFWGQCQIFIFGESVAKSGIRDHLDFLLRFPQTRERAYMFVSKGKAAEALELFPPIERSSAEVLRELEGLHIGMQVTMQQLGVMLKGEARSAVLPLVYILPKTESSAPFQTIPYLLGAAIFKEDKMVGEISEKTTRGVMWLRNEIEEYTVVFKMKDAEGQVSLKPVKASVKLIPSIQGETWKITVKVKSEGDIIQNGTNLDPMNPELLALMEKAFENDVTERIRLALREVQYHWKADILDFAKVFHRKYPEQWEKVKDRWERRFPEVEVTTEIETRILRPGTISFPGGMPKEEVKEK